MILTSASKHEVLLSVWLRALNWVAEKKRLRLSASIDEKLSIAGLHAVS